MKLKKDTTGDLKVAEDSVFQLKQHGIIRGRHTQQRYNASFVFLIENETGIIVADL